MPRYEYKVVPAPAKGQKAKGLKTPEARFALGVEAELNRLGAEGWDYLRAELLPSEERTGLTGTTVNWRNLLVFRRVLDAELAAEPPASEPPQAEAPPVPAPEVRPVPSESTSAPRLAIVAERRPPTIAPVRTGSAGESPEGSNGAGDAASPDSDRT